MIVCYLVWIIRVQNVVGMKCNIIQILRLIEAKVCDIGLLGTLLSADHG